MQAGPLGGGLLGGALEKESQGRRASENMQKSIEKQVSFGQEI